MRRILVPGRTCWSLEAVHTCGVLVDGESYFRAFHEVAARARRFILIAGWQFESEVPLLRGRDATRACGEVALLPFLNELCERNPELQIRVLAWDFNLLYAMEREWPLRWVLERTTHERVRFELDKHPALWGSHHQKLAVVDGEYAFVGGVDLCDSRWDTRQHRALNPDRRNTDGELYGPYHEVHSILRGPVALRLTRLFEERWRTAVSEDLSLRPGAPAPAADVMLELPLRAREVALARTMCASMTPGAGPIEEIRQLYEDAIDAAERVIYLENQYFSARAVHDALARRMRARGRPPLQIVILLPEHPSDRKEQIAVGGLQAELLASLREVAAEEGHSLGVYFTASTGADGRRTPIYVHSKLLLVDDRFLTLGSANTTNRSMGLDTELNAAWEAMGGADAALARDIEAVRMDLLAEHTDAPRESWRSAGDLVERLDACAVDGRGRLWSLSCPPPRSGRRMVLRFDPERPLLDEALEELTCPERKGLLSRGLSALRRWLGPRVG
jgi:phospholipase D1/2